MYKMYTNFKYNAVIVLIGIIINYIFTYIIFIAKIPFLFMDTVGTILTAVILGPIYGAIVGILSNLILSIFLSHSHLYFAIINALIGIIVGIIVRVFKFNIISVIVSGIVIGILSTIIGVPISIMISEGLTCGGLDNFINLLLDQGHDIKEAVFTASMLSNIIDKVISCIIVYIAVKKIKFFNKYPIMNKEDSDNNDDE